MQLKTRKSQTALSYARKRGFTLIEILIVMLIVSIVAGAAVMTIGHNDNKRIERFANDFSQLILMAQEQAILYPMVLGVAIEPQQFRFYQWVSAGAKAKWQLIQDDNLLKTHAIPDGLVVQLRSQRKQLEKEDDSNKKAPQIVISMNGSMTPFMLYVGKQDTKPLYVVTGEADGQVSAKRLS